MQVLLGAGLVAGLAMPAMACQGDKGSCGIEGKRMERMSEALHLTDEQQQKLQQIHDKARPQLEAVGQQMRENRQALFGLDSQAAGYEDQVAKLAREQGKLVEQMVVLRARMRAERDAVLTAEQRAQARELMQQRHERMQQRMQEHMGDGPGRGMQRDGKGPGAQM